MGKTFDSILRGLTNGTVKEEPVAAAPEPHVLVQAKKPKGWFFKNLSPEQRKAYRDQAHTALRIGMTVFMSKDTVDGFARILKTDVNSRVMRRLLEEIANGELVLASPRKPAPTAVGRDLPKPITTRPAMPVVLTVDQLSAGIPFTLKQAARILNVDEGKLYYRCLTRKIHFEKDRSRYYIPAVEVQRLQVVGL